MDLSHVIQICVQVDYTARTGRETKQKEKEKWFDSIRERTMSDIDELRADVDKIREVMIERFYALLKDTEGIAQKHNKLVLDFLELSKTFEDVVHEIDKRNADRTNCLNEMVAHINEAVEKHNELAHRFDDLTKRVDVLAERVVSHISDIEKDG
jgi:uncharacterized protein YoxC